MYVIRLSPVIEIINITLSQKNWSAYGEFAFMRIQSPMYSKGTSDDHITYATHDCGQMSVKKEVLDWAYFPRT